MNVKVPCKTHFKEKTFIQVNVVMGQSEGSGGIKLGKKEI